MKAQIWARESRDKKGYTLFTNIKPKKETGEAVYFIGNVTSQEQGNKLLHMNGRASIYELIQFLLSKDSKASIEAL